MRSVTVHHLQLCIKPFQPIILSFLLLKLGNATLSEREPVEFLLELRPTTSFNTEKTASALICFTVAVDGMKFEGYGKTKTEAQHEAATAALKALFNIVCTKGTVEMF